MSKSKDINSLIDEETKNLFDDQNKLVQNLKEENQRLLSEISRLKLMLNENIPTVKFEIPQLGVISNQELICETQIQFLKDIAIERALTTDEAKRFQVFVDVLGKIRTGGITSEDEIKVKKLSDSDLLQLVMSNGKN